MATFADMFDAAKKETETKKAVGKKEKKGEGKDAPKKEEKVHPKDDPAVRKARKERRKKEWAAKREQEAADDVKEDEKKVARRERQQVWNKARELMKKEEAEAAKYEAAVEAAMEGIGRLQAMVASGLPFDFRALSDIEYLEQNAKDLKGKKQAQAEEMCAHLNRLAKRVQRGNVSPYTVAARLPTVTAAFLNVFDDLFKANLDPKEGQKMAIMLKGHRSSVMRQQQMMFENSKEFVPVEMTAEEIAALDNEDDENEEGEEAPEVDEGDASSDETDARGGKDGLTKGDVDTLEKLRRRMTGEGAADGDDDSNAAGDQGSDPSATDEDEPGAPPAKKAAPQKRKAAAPAEGEKAAKKNKKGKGKGKK